RQELLGSAQQRAQDLTQVQPLFDLTSSSGVSGALNQFFDSFSALSVNPNDPVSRQNVIDRAGQLTKAFNQAAIGISQVSQTVSKQVGDTVSSINSLAGQIAAINQQFRDDSTSSTDEGLDSKLHNALEQLSQLTNFTVIKSNDGVFNVYIGGQTPLVI